MCIDEKIDTFRILNFIKMIKYLVEFQQKRFNKTKIKSKSDGPENT